MGSSSLDDKWQDANLLYQHIYKAFKIITENKKGEILNHLDFFPFSVFALYALPATMMGINSS